VVDREPVPSVLWLVRHGESMGNVADARAHESGAGRLDLDIRDPDVPLSDTGRSQAEALGRYLASLPDDRRPTAALSSPFARALTTAQLATAGLDVRVRTDERLRERDFGAFDGMTGAGIREQFPDEAGRRDLLGKFYYRPPGGESWADVALRLRSALRDLDDAADGRRVLVSAHDAVILLIRYICEGMDEAQILAIARQQSVLNASVTRLARTPEGTWALTTFNDATHLMAQGAPVTEHPAERDVALPR
jgi:broad specificity phosphatase PhoE